MVQNEQEVSRQINKILDEMEVAEDLREDLFQEAWVSYLEGGSVKQAVMQVVEREKAYKRIFGR